MELFSYSRYLGEEQPTTSKQSDVSDFINKVKLRKSKRKIEDTISENTLNIQVSEEAPVSNEIDNKDSEKVSQPQNEVKKAKINLLESDVKPSKKKNKKKKKKSKKGTQEGDIVEAPFPVIDLSQKTTEEVNFEILGDHNFQNKPKVKRVLPRWLAEPNIISTELEIGHTPVDKLSELNPCLRINLKAMGITHFFPVQNAVIPLLLSKLRKSSYLRPRDFCVSAPTGSGKTLAYALPILHAKTRLMSGVLHALVVVPVQELAIQVCYEFKKWAVGTGVNIGFAIGGTNFSTESQTLVGKKLDGSYYSLVDVVVATPGRLVEHIQNTPGFTLKHLRYFVIDEADRVMEQSLTWLHLVEKQFDPIRNGVIPPVTVCNLSKMTNRPQKLLFSATLSQDPEKLLQLNLFQPLLITSAAKREIDSSLPQRGHFIGKFTTPVNLKESYIVSTAYQKPLVVNKLLSDGWRKVLCFTKSCVEADRLCKVLSYMNPKLSVKGLTTLMNLMQREQVLSRFAEGQIDLLVCSDRMARGMDVKGVDFVILYDPPKYIKGYIHRVGRTGRAGLPGTATTIVIPSQESNFCQMLNVAGKIIDKLDIDMDKLSVYNELYEKTLDYLKSVIDNEKKSTILQLKKEKRKVVKTKFMSKKIKPS